MECGAHLNLMPVMKRLKFTRCMLYLKYRLCFNSKVARNEYIFNCGISKRTFCLSADSQNSIDIKKLCEQS